MIHIGAGGNPVLALSTISSITINADSDAFDEIAITLAPPRSLSLLTTSNTSFWATVLSGTTTFDSGFSPETDFAGDGIEVTAGETLNAGDDTIDFSDALFGGVIVGDVFTVAGTLVGGDDTITGSAGTQILNGGADNDFIDGSRGADEVNGGSGNDNIVYDSEDTSILGGEGIDTLEIGEQELPISFDLDANGFEFGRAFLQGDFFDWWATIERIYNTNWQQLTEHTVSKDGSTIDTSFDPENNFNWTSIADYRNPEGTLTNQTGVFDDGTLFAKSYDYAPGTDVDGIADWLTEFTYFFRNETDQINGNPLNVEGFTDDGRKFTQTNDIDDAYEWQSQTNWFQPGASDPLFVEILWDDGSTDLFYY